MKKKKINSDLSIQHDLTEAEIKAIVDSIEIDFVKIMNKVDQPSIKHASQRKYRECINSFAKFFMHVANS